MAEKVEFKIVVDAKTGALSVVRTGFKKVGNAAKKAGKKAKDSSKEWNALGKRIAALVTIGATVRFFQNATRAAVVQEDAVLRLNAALKETGEFTEESSQEIQEWAAALQNTTRIGDEVIIQQFALAKSFVKTKEASKELVNAALDFAVAADLNFTEALRRLGRATKGTTDDIAKFAPEITKLTRAQLEAGEATRIIAERFRGAAAAQAAGLGGQLTQLTNKFSDLQEVIIQQLGPAFEFWTKTLSKATDALKQILKIEREANSVTAQAIKVSMARLVLLRQRGKAIAGNKINAERFLGTLNEEINTEKRLLEQLIKTRKEEKLRAAAAQEANNIEIQKKLAREQEIRELQAAIPKKKQFLNIELRNIQDNLKAVFETRKKSNDDRLMLTAVAEEQERELVRNAREKGILTAEEFANKIIEIQTRRASELRQIRNDELAHQKTILDQGLKDNDSARRLALAEQELSEQERINLIEQSAEAARSIIMAAQEAGVIDAEEAARRLTEVDNKRQTARVGIAKEGNEDITRANEAFAKKIKNINAGIAASARQAFDKVGDAIGQSFATAIVDGKSFEKSFVGLWKNIRRQVIAQITAMIVKLIALKVMQTLTGQPGGGGGGILTKLLAKGGRTTSLGSRKPIRGLAGGGRTNGPELAVIGEGPENESVVPDSQAMGFALGALATRGVGLARRSTRKGTSSSVAAPSMDITFGDININFTGPVNLDRPENIDAILEGFAQRLKDKVEVAIRTSRLMGDTNEEESDRAV